MNNLNVAPIHAVDQIDLKAVDEALFESFPYDLAKQYQSIPLSYEKGLLVVAATKNQDIYTQTQLEAILGMQVAIKVFGQSAVEDALDYWSGQLDQLQGMSEELGFMLDEDETYTSLEDIHTDDKGPIVRLMNTIITTALQKRASDIHIEAFEHSVSVKYRIDGALFSAMSDLDQSHHGALLSRLKVMAELDIAEKRIPQDGRFKLRLNKRNIDFRLSILPGLHGENAVIRVLDNRITQAEFQTLSLDVLGMTEGQRHTFEKAIREPYGMVLMTGPTGSGKTTTLYTALTEINSGEEKIITIEDPIEYHLFGITQIPVNIKKGLTFAKGLRSILRHDPDKILVGEIRDGETADIAIQSALTGHLVFSSVHANSAMDVLARLQNMGVDPHSCLSALNCVVAQRLLRLNCDECKETVEYSDDYLGQFALNTNLIKDTVFYRGSGCEHCSGTGYFGRAMVCEVVEFTQAVRQAMLEGRSVVDALNCSTLADDVTLRQSSLNRVYAGDTTLEEVNRVTFID